jgi:hypothetical protein
MEEFSHYGNATPHSFEHIIRATGAYGAEYYFSKDVFHLLTLE